MTETQSKRKAAHWLVAGSDGFAVEQFMAKLLREAMPEDPMNYEVVDGAADTVEVACQRLDQLREALLTYPFFGGAKLVHFKKCVFLADTPAGRSEEVQKRWENIGKILQSLDPQQVQLMISATGVDRRRSFFRVFAAVGKVEFFDQPDLRSGREAQQFVAEVGKMIREMGLQADPEVPDLLVEMIGPDRRTIHNELEKLALYLHPKSRLEEEDLRRIVATTRESIVWDLNDAVIRGDAREAVHLLRQLLAQGETEVGINILLAGQVRLAAVGVYLLEAGHLRLVGGARPTGVELTAEGEALLPTSKKGEKPNSYRLARVVAQARRCPATRWFQAVEVLHQTAMELVSSGRDRARMLEAAVVKICQLDQHRK